MAFSVFQHIVRDALSGMNLLPPALADFQESMSHSVASLNLFSEFMENVLPQRDSVELADTNGDSFTDALTNEGADAATRTLFALADAGSGFEKQLQLLNPSVRAVALANESVASQINSVSVQTPGKDATAVAGFASGGRIFARLTAPFIAQGSGHADDVPAMLMRDEFVMRQAAVKKYGLPLMYALNNCELPAAQAPATLTKSKTPASTSEDAVPAYASGGVVSSKNDDDEDSWSLTVSGSSLSPDNYYHSFSTPDDATWNDEQLAEYAEELARSVRDSLGVEQMEEDAQGYLEQILSAFATDSRSVRLFASGGSSASSTLQQEKDRISEAYAAKIQTAENLGNVELTELFELQLNTMLNLIDELLYALEQLAQTYQESVEEALEEYEEEFDAIQADTGEQLAALQSQYQALSQGSSLISSLGGSADSEKELLGRTKSQMRTVENSRAEAEEEAEDLYLTRTERSLKNLKLESAYESKSTTNDGSRELVESTADLQQSYLETLQDIRDLEVERDEKLAALLEEYTTGTISGSAEYLSRGGPVGRLSALRALLEQDVSLTSGLPVTAVRAFAQGGLVSGGVQGHDSVPALLTPGEFVLNTRAVEHVGLAALESVNTSTRLWGQLPNPPEFAQGGLADAASPVATQQEHLIRFDLGVSHPSVRTDSDNLRSLVRGLKQMRKRMVR